MREKISWAYIDFVDNQVVYPAAQPLLLTFSLFCDVNTSSGYIRSNREEANMHLILVGRGVSVPQSYKHDPCRQVDQSFGMSKFSLLITFFFFFFLLICFGHLLIVNVIV